MSNYQYADVLGGNAVVGPETVNGTGQVYIQADDLCFLSNDEARELGRALIEAADYAAAVRDEMQERDGGAVSGGLVSRFEWTDPAWRDAKEQP
ncbi:hypothetical protein [Streptomyces ossamyceticus]|uniref:hypothetical protein n=1 Tax=Streptomyces ossamyceticus TaxID=249581 RepID=UPI0006E330DD|nr:hypothetical protein [Streptomyces ossamyceticus]